MTAKRVTPTMKLLREARALIAARNGWIKGSAKRRKPGVAVGPPPRNSFAAEDFAYCAYGALAQATTHTEPGAPRWKIISSSKKPGAEKAETCLQLAAKELGQSPRYQKKPRNIVAFNDHQRTRKQDVLALFDRAIELADKRR